VAPTLRHHLRSDESDASLASEDCEPKWSRCAGLFQCGYLLGILRDLTYILTCLIQDIGVQTKEIVAAYTRGGPKQTSDTEIYERSNVIHQMLDSPELPAKDKTEFRLALEVRTFVGAGTETTGNTLVVTTYHLLANPDMAKKLKVELRAAQRASLKPLTYQQLAKLSYLVCGLLSADTLQLINNPVLRYS
jgi:hypothetical protein